MDRGQAVPQSSEEIPSSDDEAMAQLEDGPNPGRTAEERQTRKNLNMKREEKVWKLKKALYGLRSSPMLWQCQLEKGLTDLDFNQEYKTPQCSYMTKEACG